MNSEPLAGFCVDVIIEIMINNLLFMLLEFFLSFRLLKRVCELNGHLGFMIKEALNAYLQGSW